jgi:hypothetical protein
MRQYAAALDGAKPAAESIGAARTLPDSFDALCVAYYRSLEFRRLKDSTQREYRLLIERLRADYGKAACDWSAAISRRSWRPRRARR